jgi:hypothetical protein
MPFCMFSAAGDAMVKGGWVVGCSEGGSRSRVGEVATDAKAWRAHAAQFSWNLGRAKCYD